VRARAHLFIETRFAKGRSPDEKGKFDELGMNSIPRDFRRRLRVTGNRVAAVIG
jgi:hypothetical protein